MAKGRTKIKNDYLLNLSWKMKYQIGSINNREIKIPGCLLEISHLNLY